MQDMKMQNMKLQDMKLQDKISTILSTQEAQNACGRTAQVRRRLVARADTPCSSCLQLLPVTPLTWKSSQSLQQVMPWLVVCVIFVAGGLVMESHRLDYFLCAQAGDLSSMCCVIFDNPRIGARIGISTRPRPPPGRLTVASKPRMHSRSLIMHRSQPSRVPPKKFTCSSSH